MLGVVAATMAGLALFAGDNRPSRRSATADGRSEGPTTVATTAVTAPVSTAPDVPPGPPDQATLDALGLRLEPVVELQHPTSLAQRPGTGDLYATSVEGAVVRLPARGGEPLEIADLGPRISTEGESGLLDLAFDTTGDLAYISLVETDGDLALLEVPIARDLLAIDRARTILTIESPTEVHHAGDVDTDAQGMVWFSVGDGGPSQEPSMRAQDLGELHGKLLRIDPRPTASAAYRIPAGNPFVGRADARPEIWAYGLRNPWRFDRDTATGDLWIGDVGRNDREELDHVPGPAAGAGVNFGWPHHEGTQAALGGGPGEVAAPVLDYSHDDGRCGITAGSVYRGAAIPELTGAFLYSDLCDGIVRAATVTNGTVVAQRAFNDAHAGYPVAFGTDLAGELYLCSFDLNAIYRITPA